MASCTNESGIVNGNCIDVTIDETTVAGNCSPLNDLPEPSPDDPNVNIPTPETVTEAKLDGKGTFDLYMRAGMVHLDKQYKDGRIKGSDYASAYIGMMELMMTQANQFVLGLVNAEVQANMFAMQYMAEKYKVLTAQSTAEKLKYDSELVCQQKAELQANGSLEREQLRKQIAKTVHESDLICQQEAELKYNGEIDRELKCQQKEEMKENGIVDRDLKGKQILKTVQETSLIHNQESELLLNGVVDRGLKTAQTAAQNKTVELYDRQIKGFDDKYETDVSKIIMDAWAAQGAEISTNPAVSELNFLTANKLEGDSTALADESFINTMLKNAGIELPNN